MLEEIICILHKETHTRTKSPKICKLNDSKKFKANNSNKKQIASFDKIENGADSVSYGFCRMSPIYILQSAQVGESPSAVSREAAKLNKCGGCKWFLLWRSSSMWTSALVVWACANKWCSFIRWENWKLTVTIGVVVVVLVIVIIVLAVVFAPSSPVWHVMSAIISLFRLIYDPCIFSTMLYFLSSQ